MPMRALLLLPFLAPFCAAPAFAQEATPAPDSIPAPDATPPAFRTFQPPATRSQRCSAIQRSISPTATNARSAARASSSVTPPTSSARCAVLAG